MNLLDRMVFAVERVRDRLLRATAALETAHILYAVAGGNAVAVWVATVDIAAVRNTQDVDILLQRADLPAAIVGLESSGFIYDQVAGVDVFLDGPHATPRDAVHIVFAGEKIRPAYEVAAPGVAESEKAGALRVLALEALVKMKLTSYRRKDQVHLLDLLEVGLIDATWPGRFVPALAARLQQLLDNPDQ